MSCPLISSSAKKMLTFKQYITEVQGKVVKKDDLETDEAGKKQKSLKTDKKKKVSTKVKSSKGTAKKSGKAKSKLKLVPQISMTG